MAINPATGLEDPQYTPITVPPDGLLNTAVGSPTAPLPPIDPNVYEDDDVVTQMNRITSADSDYMQLAKTAGLQTANKRGLLNSSMAAGASQAEALKAAAPLAMQTAAQRAARNLERVSGYQKGKLQEAVFSHDTEMQERQLSAAEQQQLREIGTRLQMQGIDIGNQQLLQQRQLDSSRQLAEMNIAAESDRLGRQLTAAEEQQIRDLASRESLLNLELASREALTREDFENKIALTNLTEAGANTRANLDAATRTQLMAMENLSQEQQAALSYYLNSNQIYAHSLDQLYANKDMPAPARDAAIQNFLALRNASANLPAILFGTELNWPTSPTTGTAPGTAPSVPPLAGGGNYWTGPSPEEIMSMYGDGAAGGYGYDSSGEALAAYNAWARANGQPELSPPGSGGTTGGTTGGGSFFGGLLRSGA